jgi:hypothetical protein
MNNKIVKAAFLLLLPVLAAVLFACAQTATIAAWHPVEVTAPPLCSDCHNDDRAAMNHTPDYSTRHKFYAAQNKQTCGICHKESFCSDCHAHKDELKPSDKYKDSPERSLPHRGDYLNQHRIDGRINPASCFPCHGRQNNERCKVCHIK